MSRWVDPMTPADWSARAAWSDTLRRRQEQVARERAIAATAEPKV